MAHTHTHTIVCMCAQTQPHRINTRQRGQQRKQAVFYGVCWKIHWCEQHPNTHEHTVHWTACSPGNQLVDGWTAQEIFCLVLFLNFQIIRKHCSFFVMFMCHELGQKIFYLVCYEWMTHVTGATSLFVGTAGILNKLVVLALSRDLKDNI